MHPHFQARNPNFDWLAQSAGDEGRACGGLAAVTIIVLGTLRSFRWTDIGILSENIQKFYMFTYICIYKYVY
jgi:hypothetical protein